MKKPLLILSFICIMSNIYAQTEKAVNKTAADNFEKYYNAGDDDAIYSMFAANMQAALSVDKTKDYLAQLKTALGNLTKKEFIKYDAGFAVYKGSFERSVFGLYIAADDEGKISGLTAKPYTESKLPQIIRNNTKLVLPFKDEWTVIWGGDTKELNYHVESVAQKNAFDMVITDAANKSYRTDGKTNKDYYAFGKPLYAPCNGEVILVVDGVKENTPGTANPFFISGNTVIIKTVNNEYLFFAHFKQHSILVKQGQQVYRGNQLGQCGNTGNSSEPHLHFHIQNVEDINLATGVKCYFDNIIANGQAKTDYSPVKKDKIRNSQ